MNEAPKIKPIPIIVTNYNRLEFLKRTIESINERTLYPHYIFVVDNNSTDGSQHYIKTLKVNGKIFDFLLMPDNLGQANALNKVFWHMESWQDKRSMDDFIVTTNEDLLPPKLSPCWLEQMVEIFKENERDGLGALSMRIQRMSRADIDEGSDIFYWNKGIPSVYRLMRRTDLIKLGHRPFGRLTKWESNSTADKFRFQLKKRYGFATHIYANHLGWCENRGYDNKDFLTYASNKENVHEDSPYPDIDPETNEPIKSNYYRDDGEQEKREIQRAIDRGDIKRETTIIIPTHRRPNGLKRMIDSVKAHTNSLIYDLLVIIDNDDVEAYQWCILNNINCMLSSWHRDFVAQANAGVYMCKTPYFVIMADDMEVTEDGWLEKGLESFKQKFSDGIGIMCFDDGIQHGRIFTHGLSSKRFVHYAGGYLYFPKYIHYGGDNELSSWAKHVGKYHYCPEIKVNHYHPTNKNSDLVNKNDDTYTLSEKFNHQDQQLKKARKKDMGLLEKNKNYYDYFEE